jgi:hypothetical protein
MTEDENITAMVVGGCLLVVVIIIALWVLSGATWAMP